MRAIAPMNGAVCLAVSNGDCDGADPSLRRDRGEQTIASGQWHGPSMCGYRWRGGSW